MLAHYVMELFNDDACAQQFSDNARKHARITHDPEVNTRTLLEIYNVIGSESKQ